MPRAFSSCRTAGAALLVAASIAAAGCSSKEERGEQGAAAAQRYSFRGEVVKLPDARHKSPQVTLRHEAIPDFRDQSGTVVGMSSMVMPFDASPATFDGIAVGDKVEALLAADWSRASFRIERARKLPPDTALDFGAPRPDATPAGAAR
jgi:Cu/Ag efflux protein CusF